VGGPAHPVPPETRSLTKFWRGRSLPPVGAVRRNQRRYVLRGRGRCAARRGRRGAQPASGRRPGVRRIAADARDAPLAERGYAVWHDRAVFHFLTKPADRQAYVTQVQRAVEPGGYVLVATFAEDGPATCSGLPVVRYSAESLHSEFGPAFRIVTSAHEDHHTPSGREQPFLYCLCRRE